MFTVIVPTKVVSSPDTNPGADSAKDKKEQVESKADDEDDPTRELPY